MRILVSEKLSPHKMKTPEGYLICTDAILSRTGKQTYRRSELWGDACDNADEEVEVDRKAEEVFNDKTLASFENKPICIEHPDEDVNVNNHNQLSVGFVRDIKRGKVDGQDVMLGTLVITDADAVEAIERGDYTELSCGYNCDIVDEDNPQQRNIRGNHVALCEHGRAGIARIVDSANDMAVMRFEFSTNLAAFERAIINNDIAEFNAMLSTFEKDIDDYNTWKKENKLSSADIGKVKRQVDKVNSLLTKSKINKKFEVKDMATLKDEDFSKQTKQGYQVLEIYRDGGRLHIIFKRANDYGIGLGYNTTDGQWSQGRYDFSTLEKARQALIEEKPYARRIQDDMKDEDMKDMYIQIDMTDKWGRVHSFIVKSKQVEEAKAKVEKRYPELKYKTSYQASESNVAWAKRRNLLIDDDDWSEVEEENYKKANEASLKKDTDEASMNDEDSWRIKNVGTAYVLYYGSNEVKRFPTKRLAIEWVASRFPNDKIKTEDSLKMFEISYVKDDVTHICRVKAQSLQDALAKVKTQDAGALPSSTWQHGSVYVNYSSEITSQKIVSDIRSYMRSAGFAVCKIESGKVDELTISLNVSVVPSGKKGNAASFTFDLTYIPTSSYEYKYKSKDVSYKQIETQLRKFTNSKLYEDRSLGDANAKDSTHCEQLFTIEYKQGGVTCINKVRANSIEDAISKVKDNKFIGEGIVTQVYGDRFGHKFDVSVAGKVYKFVTQNNIASAGAASKNDKVKVYQTDGGSIVFVLK